MEIEDRVKKVVSEMLGVHEADIKNDATFESMSADSLDELELVMALEEEFEADISDDEAAKIETVQQAVDYIKARRSV